MRYFLLTKGVEMSAPKVFKTSVNLPEVTVAALESLAKKRGKSMSQIIRDAIATETFLQETADSGGKVLIKDKDETLRQLLVR